MELKRKPYFYNAQLKRALVQFMACFAGYQVQTGTQRDGNTRFLDVPIIYGDMSTTVGYAMSGGSENTMNYIPIMSLYMTGIRQKGDWRQAPQHHEKFRYVERAMTPDGELLVNKPGKRKTVERFQPVPYDITFEVAIWASNNDQGYQLVEQIGTVFNPDMDIQLSNSPADWTFLTSIIYQGDVRMERAIPSGSDIDALYVFTLPFEAVIWFNPPVKVYETKHIYTIHVPILELQKDVDFDKLEEIDGLVIRADEQDIILFESFQ